MSKLHIKHKYRFVWILLVIILLVVYGFVFWYVKGKVQTASFENSRANIAYEQKDTIQDTLAVLQEIQPDIQKIDSFFVGSDSVVDFINLLEERGVQEGVSVETTNVDILEEAEDGVEKIPYGEVLRVGLGVSGDWSDVLQYARLIEQLPYNIWIESLQVTLEEDRDTEIDVELEEPIFIWQASMVINVIKHPEL